MNKLEQLKAAHEGSTQGEWRPELCQCGWPGCHRTQLSNGTFYRGSGFDPQDAQAIALFHTHGDALIEAIELLQGVADNPDISGITFAAMANRVLEKFK